MVARGQSSLQLWTFVPFQSLSHLATMGYVVGDIPELLSLVQRNRSIGLKRATGMMFQSVECLADQREH